MKIRCIAVDDEPLALNKLKRNILKFPFLELVAACHNTIQASRVLETENIDLVYIDINMPDANGFEFIRNLDNPPMVVFVTAYSEYAVESYKLSALDYLLKPYGSDDFKRTAEKAYKTMQLIDKSQENASQTQRKDVLYLKCDHRYIAVKPEEILYIEGQSEYLKIHLQSSEPFLTHMTFKQIGELLSYDFIQIHRSYIANMKHAVSVERTMVVLDDGTRLPVSDSRRSFLIEYMKNPSL